MSKQRVPIEDRPADDEQETHRRLENWAEWCRTKGIHRGRAGSAEGGYVAPSVLHRRTSGTPGVDPFDAERVNSALIRVGRAQRMALELRYFGALPDRAIARIVGVRGAIYPRFMRVARLSVRNVICKAEKTSALSGLNNPSAPKAHSED